MEIVQQQHNLWIKLGGSEKKSLIKILLWKIYDLNWIFRALNDAGKQKTEKLCSRFDTNFAFLIYFCSDMENVYL